jgi:hypothetical protein
MPDFFGDRRGIYRSLEVQKCGEKGYRNLYEGAVEEMGGTNGECLSGGQHIGIAKRVSSMFRAPGLPRMT